VGYAGPIGLPPEVTVIADHYTYNRVNFECGANRTDYHYIDVNFGRDFPLPTFGDFKLTKEGNLCPRCNKGKLKEAHGIEIGHIIKLGTKYSLKMTCNYQDKTGKTHPVYMGCYGLNVSRISAAVIEQNHDDGGIIWPIHIAPYQVHLIGLNLEKEDVRNETENLYRRLLEEKIDVLYDDRDLRAGEKFSDADLFGMPVRLTISKKTCKEHRIELKFRDKSQSEFLSYNETLKTIKDFCT
jgi:prolyl-tRNA synthetase